TLLLALSFIKLIFYYYNSRLLFANTVNMPSWSSFLCIAKWSFYTDLLVLLPINILFLLLLQLSYIIKRKIYTILLLLLFTICNTLILILNVVDVFYYRFHNQHVNADILYVVDSPLQKLKEINVFVLIGAFMATLVIIFFVFKLHKWLIANFEKGKTNLHCLTAAAGLILFIFLFNNNISKYLLPTLPLTQLNSNELIISQNSAHTFLYSVFRKGEQLPLSDYFAVAKCDSLVCIKQHLSTPQKTKKNIVLFIMESVPFDFFDSTNKYYTKLPFFTSLLQKSTFYTNAFCFSHESNKGITAILGGVPTITEIPLYHSSYITMPLTKIGTTLSQQNYQSIFCIGDNYDDFGFAKCTNWLGFNNYYSKESLPSYSTLPSQAMGIHDEYVLDFMHKKIDNLPQPFFSVNFNISTHYDYELPKNFTQIFSEKYSTAMKSMAYYDYSLNKFFEASKNETWFKNTVFIFCSDHWMFPNEKNLVYNNVANYKIPIIIYDASNEAKKTDPTIASQFDILPTLLDVSGYTGEFISYGNSLLQNKRNNFALVKINSILYQIIDSTYALAFNTANNKTEYLYNYKEDANLKINLVDLPEFTMHKQRLEEKIKAILQKAAMQYGNKNFN
nr:sulfatase-like hydrolase/transferase [Ferruginibacter sp.]